MTKEELLALQPRDKVKKLCGIVRNNGRRIYCDAEIIQVTEGISDCTHVVRADIKYQQDGREIIMYAVPAYELELI